MAQKLVWRGDSAVVLELAPGDYQFACQHEYTLQSKDSHDVLRDIEVGEALSRYSRRVILTEQTTVVIAPKGEATLLLTVPDPLHSWSPRAIGPELELEPGKYRLESPITVAVSLLTSSPETPASEQVWKSVSLSATNQFVVPAKAVYRIEYPNGGKASTNLFME